MTGFGTGWFDYDNDGWLDLFIANGAVNIVEALRGQPMPFRQRNQLFHNDGRPRSAEVTAGAGPAFELLEVSRGAAFGDIDNDGDVDILVTNNSGPVRLLLNEASHPASQALRLGARSGTTGSRLPCAQTLAIASASARGSESNAPASRPCGAVREATAVT